MNTPDYIVLIVYLIGIFAVGVLLAAQNKNADEMFAAGGRSPWWASGLSGFMTMFSAGTFVVWGGIAYQHGMVAVAINLCYGVAALIVGYTIAGRWKEMGVHSPSQFIELRYGRGALHFYIWSMMAYRIVSVGVALYAMAVLLVASMPMAEGNPLRDAATGNLSLPWAIVLFGGVVIVYTMIGGLWGVLMTDVLQFIVLNLAILFVVPLAISGGGGLSHFVTTAPEGFFALTAPNAGYTWFFLAGWTAIHFFVVGAEWAFVQRFICVPTAGDARKSACLFGALYLLSPLLWLLPPMIYRIEQPIPAGATASEIQLMAEQAYIKACRSVLPAGMFGLLIAAMFSATASMISSQLNVFAGVLTNDVYRPFVSGVPTDRQLVRAGRIFSIIIGLAFIGMALAIPHIGGAEKVIIAATSLLIAPLLTPTIGGLLSRKLTARAVWFTAIVTVSIGSLVKFGLAPNGWFAGVSKFAPLADWVQTHGNSVDLILGLGLPIGTLLLLHALSDGLAPGWQRVADMSHRKQHDRLQQPTEASRLPVLIVAYSLLTCGVMMFGLVVGDGHDQAVLLLFAATLSSLGVAILAYRYWPTRTRKKSIHVEG